MKVDSAGNPFPLLQPSHVPFNTRRKPVDMVPIMNILCERKLRNRTGETGCPGAVTSSLRASGGQRPGPSSKAGSAHQRAPWTLGFSPRSTGQGRAGEDRPGPLASSRHPAKPARQTACGCGERLRLPHYHHAPPRTPSGLSDEPCCLSAPAGELGLIVRPAGSGGGWPPPPPSPSRVTV